MNCNETFNAGICYVTDAYKSVCRFNEELHADLEKYRTENAKLREQIQDAEHEESVAWDRVRSAERRSDKLQEQIEMLVTLLRNDCDIDASWDGLRKFWNIGLTEDGCLMRDRACKAEAENAKLRELLLDVADVLEEHTKLRKLAERLRSAASDGADNARDVFAENAKLRKLLLDVWNDAMQFDGFWDYVHDDGEIYNEDELPYYQERMRELGIEVDA